MSRCRATGTTFSANTTRAVIGRLRAATYTGIACMIIGDARVSKADEKLPEPRRIFRRGCSPVLCCARVLFIFSPGHDSGLCCLCGSQHVHLRRICCRQVVGKRGNLADSRSHSALPVTDGRLARGAPRAAGAAPQDQEGAFPVRVVDYRRSERLCVRLVVYTDRSSGVASPVHDCQEPSPGLRAAPVQTALQ